MENVSGSEDVTRDYEIDAISEASPDMSEAEMLALKESIAAIGQQVPILVWRGRVIDGRKRLAACESLGATPRVTSLADEDSPEQYAAALNLLRTHYTESQRAMFAERIAQPDRSASQRAAWALRKNDRLNLDDHRPSQRQAAAAFGVAPSSVAKARALRQAASSEVTQAVEAGKLSLHAATQIANAVPRGEQAGIVERVVESSKGKARHTPVARVINEHADGRRDRATPKPGHEQFARSVQSMEVLVDVMTRNVDTVAHDARRKSLLESLRYIRTTITRVINNMENVA